MKIEKELKIQITTEESKMFDNVWSMLDDVAAELGVDLINNIDSEEILQAMNIIDTIKNYATIVE